MDTSVTKDGILVESGQVWRDLDKRMPDRYAKVAAVREGKAVMNICTSHGRVINAMREIKVAVKRMHKCSTGWELCTGGNGKVTTIGGFPDGLPEEPGSRARFSIEE